jgi:SAM-dependent methyltransferase
MSPNEAEERLEETLLSYSRHPNFYANRYCTADLSVYRNEFLGALPSVSGFVLDGGCGPGRDCKEFYQAGMSVVGLDRSIELLRISQSRTPAPLIAGDLLRLPFRPRSFDGVWLCSSLVHLPSTFIEEVLLRVRKLLKREGVVFASIINGSRSGWQPDPFGGRRWFAQLREEEALELVSRVGLVLIKSSIKPGALSGTWINLLARREE